MLITSRTETSQLPRSGVLEAPGKIFLSKRSAVCFTLFFPLRFALQKYAHEFFRRLHMFLRDPTIWTGQQAMAHGFSWGRRISWHQPGGMRSGLGWRLRSEKFIAEQS